MPSRRDALRACGAVLTLSVAGCLSSGINRTGTDGSTTELTTESTANPMTNPTPPEAREVSVSGVERGMPTALPDVRWPDEPFCAFAVGERSADSTDESYTLWIGNATDDARTVEFALTTLLEELIEFEPGTVLVVELREQRTYEMLVRSGELEMTVEVERSRIDCNRSATDVAITKDGVETASVTTDMAYGTTTV